MHSKLKTLAVALGAAALMVPAASAAKPEKPAGKKGQDKAKNAVFRGTVEAFDAAAETVTVKVTSTSKWGRRFDEQSVVFSVADVKKLHVADTNADGKRDLADLKGGERAHVQARVTKEQAAPLSARKFKAQAPEAVEAAEGESQE